MILNWKLGSALALTLAISPIFAAGKEDNKGYTYLALGDSIPFGFDPTKFANPSALPKPGEFIGYPEFLAPTPFQNRLVNAACPGETSASFIVVGAPDNGCNGLGPDGQPPFKTSIGLKVDYVGLSQLQFAKREIRGNKSIKLVTLSIGGNDLSLLQKMCTTGGVLDAGCVTGNSPGVFGMYATNLAVILREIRQGAKYEGALVLMTNYVPNNIPLFIGVVAAFNAVMIDVGSNFGVKVADGFKAFQLASSPPQFGGDPCAAGLLVRLSPTVCDIHASAAGQALLAFSVLSAR